MTINAANGGGVSRFTIKLSVSVDIVQKMAVTTLHALGNMNILQVNRVLSAPIFKTSRVSMS